MKKPKTNRKKIENELDKVCSILAVKRDMGCVRCGSQKGLAAHHCFGRVNKSVRWDLDNLVTLCYPCHRYFAHGNPLGFATWLEGRIGRSKYEQLTLKAKSVCKRTEFDLLFLLSERKKMLTLA